MRAAEYRRELGSRVDVKSTQKSPRVLVHLFVHLSVIVSVDLWVALHMRETPWYYVFPLSLLSGHSLMVSALCSHELGHGAARMPNWLRRTILRMGYCFVVVAVPTVQRRAHNQLHHMMENTPRDPDRRMTIEEIKLSGAERIAVWLLPNRQHPLVSGLLGFALSVFSYLTSIFWHSVLRTGELYDVRLDERSRRIAIAEALFNVSVQLALIVLSGSPWMLAFLALQFYVGASGAGLYIATNHLLSGLSDEAARDPLASSLSLTVPRWLDFVHLNFSHHTEHHVYPGASYRVLPEVRKALREQFPERYRELSFPAAIRLLLSLPLAVLDKNTLAEPSGQANMPIPFRSFDEGPFERKRS
jgi:fatty acid desaturase